jgi:V-type H+-transporting ATPase proteolipid subunit
LAVARNDKLEQIPDARPDGVKASGDEESPLGGVPSMPDGAGAGEDRSQPQTEPREAADNQRRYGYTDEADDYKVALRPDGKPSCYAGLAHAGALGALGVACAMTFCTLGAGYGMGKSAMGVIHLATLAPSAMLRGLIPVVMSELLGIYGFISCLNIMKNLNMKDYSQWAGYLDLASGVTVGLSCLAAGVTIGTIGEANVRAYGILLRRSQHTYKSKSTHSPLISSPKPTDWQNGPRSRAKSPSVSPLSATKLTDLSSPSNAEAGLAEENRVAAGRLFSAMVITMIFAEGIGLYGMIVGMLLNGNAASSGCVVSYRFERPRLQSAALHWNAYCPGTSAAFFGAIGATLSTAGSISGAAYGIAKSSTGAAHLGIRNHAKLLRGTTPVVMAELLAVYGFVNSLIIALSLDSSKYTFFSGFLDLAAGTAVGFGCLASGLAIGTVGDACVRAYGKQDRVFVAMVLILIFAEALGLFSLIAGLLLHSTGTRGYHSCD